MTKTVKKFSLFGGNKDPQEKIFIISIFLLNLGLRLFRLDWPNHSYFDESKYYLNAARDILAAKADPNFAHPPLAKELIALGIKFFGDNPWGWRSLQAILASLAVVAVYFIAKRLFHNFVVARIAAFLMTFELSWFVLSRVAIPEMFMISFFIFSLFFFLKFYQEEDKLSLILGSAFFGLAVACKWAPLLFLPIILYCFVIKLRLKNTAKLQVATIAILVFLISYLSPFFLLPKQYSLTDVINFHQKALNFHLKEEIKTIHKNPSIATSAIFWPVDFYFMNGDKFEQGNTVHAGVVGFFYSPAILWTALVLSGVYLKRFLRKRVVDTDLLLVASLLIFWLPWFLSPRDTYPYYWAIAMPFAAILVAQFLNRKKEKYKLEFGAYLVSALLLFVAYYPIMTSIPVKAWYLQLLTGIGFK